MNLKKILISEVEKKNILSQYGIITEQDTPTNILKVDVKVNFKGGYHSQEYANFKETLEPELLKVRNFLSAGKGKAFFVKVVVGSGESRIPNTDNEIEAPNNKLNLGDLSKKRELTIKNYVSDFLQSYVNSGVLLSKPNIVTKEPVIGETEWIGQPFCPKNKIPSDDPQGYICTKSNFVPAPGVKNWTQGKAKEYKSIFDAYVKEQYISVNIELKEIPSTIIECLTNMQIQINYTDISKKHKCNSAVYEIKVNGVTLTRNDGKPYASLNNNNDQYDNDPKTCKGNPDTDETCKRYNTFIVDSNLATSILTSTNFIDGEVPKFNITATCLNPNNNIAWNGGCHKGVGNIVVINGKDQRFDYTSATPNKKGETTSLREIDACGKS